MATPTSTALSSVPLPGRTRSGTQRTSRAKLVATVAVPTDSGVRTETPSANTLHGELPSSEATRSASPTPKIHSPTRSRPSRGAPGRQRERGMKAP